MGYETKYDIEITKDGQEDDWLIDVLIESIKYHPFDESCTWYAHEDDLEKFSKKYPENLFKLSGRGENFPDLWIKYFKNGKMQKCIGEVVYPPYDESQLI